MTELQASEMITYLDAMNQVMVSGQKTNTLILFFLMILTGFLIGYITGSKR